MQTHANTLNTWLFLGVTGHTSCVKYVNVCNMISTFQSAAVAGSKTLRKKYAVDLRNPVQAMSGFLMVPSLALSSQVYKMLRQRQLGPLLPPPWLCQTCKLYNAACDWFACGAWRKNMNRWTRKKPWTEGRHLHCRVRHQEKHSKKHPRVATWQLMASHPDSQATHGQHDPSKCDRKAVLCWLFRHSRQQRLWVPWKQRQADHGTHAVLANACKLDAQTTKTMITMIKSYAPWTLQQF